MEIKVITYEESRLEFFKKELKNANKKMSMIGRKKFKSKEERHLIMSDVGAEVSYYQDIVKMLEEKENENHTVR